MNWGLLNIFMSLFEQKLIGIGQRQTESGQECSIHRSQGQDYYRESVKTKKPIIWFANTKSLAGYLWLVVLRF